jgi:wyosine [tRNA(Phe)-imidazoG37] synthetase (radical SAM superfamily)
MSLGINLLPADKRVCSFNCVYCQYRKGGGRAVFPKFEELTASLETEFERLRASGTHVDWIMFSGNGEPTLHSDFNQIVPFVLGLRDALLPKTPVGILSNSSTCHQDDIARTLSALDGRFMKLDAGNLHAFHDVNRPVSMWSWGDVVTGLCKLPNITIQSMFVAGLVDNTSEADIADWVHAIECIAPEEVQVYTVDREPQEEGVLPVSNEKLAEISKRLYKTCGIWPTVFGYEAL